MWNKFVTDYFEFIRDCNGKIYINEYNFRMTGVVQGVMKVFDHD